MSNFKGFVYGTQEQIDEIENKDEDKIYIATDVEIATKSYVDNLITGALGGEY